MRILAATWKTAAAYLEAAWEMQTAEDAAEAVVCAVEDDPSDRSVGYNGSLTSGGRAELDAAFMEGAERRIGAVASLVGFRHPVSAARSVLERSPHNLLIGAGAADFAARMGLERREMASPEALEEYRRFREEGKGEQTGHDTVGVIALCDGHFACALSTSGLRFRAPGRVSDSALPGCGFFCDDRVGAAVATGIGEDIMRGALASRAFLYMEQGESAPAAALRAVRDVHTRLRGVGRVSVLAVDASGRWGGASNHDLFRVSLREEGRAARCEQIPYCFAGDMGIPMAEGE